MCETHRDGSFYTLNVYISRCYLKGTKRTYNSNDKVNITKKQIKLFNIKIIKKTLRKKN